MCAYWSKGVSKSRAFHRQIGAKKRNILVTYPRSNASTLVQRTTFLFAQRPTDATFFGRAVILRFDHVRRAGN